MTTPVLGSIGERVDIALRAGDTLGPFALTITDPVTLLAVNLTGYTFDGAISKDEDTGADIAMTVIITDAVNGLVSMKLVSTSTLDGGSNYFSAVNTYAWRLKMTDTIGTVQTLMYGRLSVAPGVLP